MLDVFHSPHSNEFQSFQGFGSSANSSFKEPVNFYGIRQTQVPTFSSGYSHYQGSSNYIQNPMHPFSPLRPFSNVQRIDLQSDLRHHHSESNAQDRRGSTHLKRKLDDYTMISAHNDSDIEYPSREKKATTISRAFPEQLSYHRSRTETGNGVQKPLLGKHTLEDVSGNESDQHKRMFTETLWRERIPYEETTVEESNEEGCRVELLDEDGDNTLQIGNRISSKREDQTKNEHLTIPTPTLDFAQKQKENQLVVYQNPNSILMEPFEREKNRMIHLLSHPTYDQSYNRQSLLKDGKCHLVRTGTLSMIDPPRILGENIDHHPINEIHDRFEQELSSDDECPRVVEIFDTDELNPNKDSLEIDNLKLPLRENQEKQQPLEEMSETPEVHFLESELDSMDLE